MITSLKLRQFRNHNNLELDFHDPLVVITGQNAIGKTNILEAIYVSSLTKSFRVSDYKLVSRGKDFFTIDRVQDDQNIHVRLTLSGSSKNKQIRLNKSNITQLSFIGRFPVTLFEPNDLGLFTSGPGDRRRFIDKIISQTDPVYLQNLRDYKRILAQRNSLLRSSKKSYNKNLKQQLFVYNIQLSEPSEYITSSRRDFTSSISSIVSKYYLSISGQKQKITIDYHGSSENKDDFIRKLEKSQYLDIASARSNVGPHREDFTTLLGGEVLADTASRGELRSLVLALKLAELDYIEKCLSVRPTLLLDDVLSELDPTRQEFLLSQLGRQQTFITTTHLPEKMIKNFQHITLPL